MELGIDNEPSRVPGLPRCWMFGMADLPEGRRCRLKRRPIGRSRCGDGNTTPRIFCGNRRTEAPALIEELAEGADFAELAEERSTGPSGPNGGDLGWFSAA